MPAEVSRPVVGVAPGHDPAAIGGACRSRRSVGLGLKAPRPPAMGLDQTAVRIVRRALIEGGGVTVAGEGNDRVGRRRT